MSFYGSFCPVAFDLSFIIYSLNPSLKEPETRSATYSFRYLQILTSRLHNIIKVSCYDWALKMYGFVRRPRAQYKI